MGKQLYSVVALLVLGLVQLSSTQTPQLRSRQRTRPSDSDTDSYGSQTGYGSQPTISRDEIPTLPVERPSKPVDTSYGGYGSQQTLTRDIPLPVQPRPVAPRPVETQYGGQQPQRTLSRDRPSTGGYGSQTVERPKISKDQTPTLPVAPPTTNGGYGQRQEKQISKDVPQFGGYGGRQTIFRDTATTTTTTTTTTPAPAYGGYGQRQEKPRRLPQPVDTSYGGSQQTLTRDMPIPLPVQPRPVAPKPVDQSYGGYGTPTISKDLPKPVRKLRPLAPQRDEVDLCSPNPCQNGGECATQQGYNGLEIKCTCTQYFYGDRCENAYGQQQQPNLSFDEVDQVEPMGKGACSQNPCLNEATCKDTQGGFLCVCPWGWTGRRCEICTTECASNPCPSNKKCRAKFGGGFDCICPADRTGQNCEIQNDACSINPCLNGGICKPEGKLRPYTCMCTTPWDGINCEEQWNNPCTEEALRSIDVVQFKYPWDSKKYIICTDIDEWTAMSCAPKTTFDEDMGHCLPEDYEKPPCPKGYCKNDGECIREMDGTVGCLCKAGFEGDDCGKNTDECELNNNACAGGRCVDQINTYYCECDGGASVGLNCRDTMPHPCDSETQDMELVYFPLTGSDKHFLHCTGVDQFTVSKCAGELFWNQEEKTCTLDRPLPQSGICATFPCKNAGHCLDLGYSNFKCVCKEGYQGQLCEETKDHCESNPCMNGGRCLAYTGGYTCVCPDKIIDECCCNGVLNPCPKKEKLIPGVNNYFPHLFPHRYIHCDFEGRAFVRSCAPGTNWRQNVLSCLPDDYVLNLTSTNTIQQDIPVQQATYGNTINTRPQAPTYGGSLNRDVRPKQPTYGETISREQAPKQPTYGGSLNRDMPPKQPTYGKTISRDEPPKQPTYGKTISRDEPPKQPTYGQTISRDEPPKQPTYGQTISRDEPPKQPTYGGSLNRDMPPKQPTYGGSLNRDMPPKQPTYGGSLNRDMTPTPAPQTQGGYGNMDGGNLPTIDDGSLDGEFDDGQGGDESLSVGVGRLADPEPEFYPDEGHEDTDDFSQQTQQQQPTRGVQAPTREQRLIFVNGRSEVPPTSNQLFLTNSNLPKQNGRRV